MKTVPLLSLPLSEKTLWDWLQLLIVPLVLVVVGFWLSVQQDARQQAIEEQRGKSQLSAEEQRAQDEALQAYLDNMQILLIEKNLLTSVEGSVVRSVAQARTLTVMERLDGKRNESVVTFLSQTLLLGPGVSEDSEKRGETLPYEDSISLLRGSDMEGFDLSGCDFIAADLSDTILNDVNLSDAGLLVANVRSALLPKANLNDSTLANVDFSNSDLHDATFRDATLMGANFTNANLSNADFTGAKVLSPESERGLVTEDYFAEAESIEGAIMGDGTKHD